MSFFGIAGWKRDVQVPHKSPGPLHCIKKIKYLILYILYDAKFNMFQNMKIVTIYD